MPTVLVVEDDRELRQFITYALMDAGMSCVEASDGRQALEVLCQSTSERESFSCILLDILLPGGMDGWDVLEAVRSNPLWRSVPVIVLSGKATLEAEVRRAELLGACHIEKTARFVDEVVDKVNELLGGEGRREPGTGNRES